MDGADDGATWRATLMATIQRKAVHPVGRWQRPALLRGVVLRRLRGEQQQQQQQASRFAKRFWGIRMPDWHFETWATAMLKEKKSAPLMCSNRLD